MKVFPAHFAVAKKYNLPMIMRTNQAFDDFIQVVTDHRKDFSNGLVSSF
jgi:Tat protein secretion system quality control protein TatD with DNase activity